MVKAWIWAWIWVTMLGSHIGADIFIGLAIPFYYYYVYKGTKPPKGPKP